MTPELEIERLSDEELRDELQRRVELILHRPPTTGDSGNLSELPPGSWAYPTVDIPARDGTLASEYKAMTRLALARMRELLAIPLDPTDSNYAASLRGINSAVSTLLTFISKASEDLIRPPKDDALPKLIAIMKEESKILWEKRLPELAHRLIELSDNQVEELLAKRREHLELKKELYADFRNDGTNTRPERDPTRGRQRSGAA
jgi:hypothetical protein